LVGRDDAKFAAKGGKLVAPGPVRFGKAVEKEDRLAIGRAANRYVERNSGRKRDAGHRDFGHG
jgi:hypothetical protein